MATKPSGLYYINKMARIYVLTVEETIGSDAMKTIYNIAGVPLDLYPPPNNFAKAFDFAYFAAINNAIDRMYGPRGGRGLTRHAGRASFAEGHAEFGTLVGASELAFKAIPVGAKLKIGLRAMAETFSKFSDQLTTIEDAGDFIIYTIHQCPVCWHRTDDRPICHAAAGILEEGARWVSGGKSFHVEEMACRATGDQACVFHVQKRPISPRPDRVTP